MRRLLVTAGLGLTLLAGCGSGATPGPSSSTAGMPSAPSSVADVPAPSEAGSAGSTAAPASAETASGSTEASPTADATPTAIELPPISGLPVRTLPLPPGATAVRDEQQPEESSTQSYTVTAPATTGADLSAWYQTALPAAGFTVAAAAEDGSFAWQGGGVTGTGAVSADAFVLGVAPQG